MKKPIAILVIIHDDLKDYPREKLKEDYFSWVQAELEEISGRHVFIYMSEINDAPELAGYNYRNSDYNISVSDWEKRVKEFHNAMSEKESFDKNLIKFLLLTRYNISETLKDSVKTTILGVAYQKGDIGIAAICSTYTPAHEIGHMLGATHEDSERIYNGAWHNTIMRSGDDRTRRFSDKNRQNIREYLNQFP